MSVGGIELPVLDFELPWDLTVRLDKERSGFDEVVGGGKKLDKVVAAEVVHIGLDLNNTGLYMAVLKEIFDIGYTACDLLQLFDCVIGCAS